AVGQPLGAGPTIDILPIAGSDAGHFGTANLIAHHCTVLDALIAQLPTVEATALRELATIDAHLLPAIDARLLAVSDAALLPLEIASLHALDPLRANVAALDPAIGA